MNVQRVGVLVVTHGQIGRELVSAGAMIVGEIGHMEVISIGWNNDVEQSKAAIEQGIVRVNQGKGVIILTDMFGGTPSNLSLPFLRKGEVEIITGVNLPMIIKLANQSGNESIGELLTRVKEQGQNQISIASELLGE